MTCLSTHPSTPFKYCVLQTGNVKCIPDGNQRLLSTALGETEVGEAPGCEGRTLERLMGAGKCQKRSTENTVACCCDLLAGWHRGFCTRKKQRGKGSVKNPASGCPTGVRACTLMATREGRPLSRGTRRWKPFLGFWREMVVRWREPTHQQRSLNQAFPGRELNGEQKGKREVNTYLPEIQGEIAGKGDPTMSKHVTVIVCEAQHGGGGAPEQVVAFLGGRCQCGLQENCAHPTKTKRFPDDTAGLSRVTLAPASMEPEEVFSGICFLLGPRGVWVTTDSMAGLRIQPFPSCFPPLLRKEDREEGL